MDVSTDEALPSVPPGFSDGSTAVLAGIPTPVQEPSQGDLADEAERLDWLLEIAQKKAILQQIAPEQLGVDLRESFGDFVGPPGIPWAADGGDGLGSVYPWGGFSSVGGLLGDRADGRNRPFWETEAQLSVIRARSRFLAQLDCTGVGILESLCDYVIGDGYVFTVSPKKNANPPTRLEAAAQQVIDEFMERNEFVGNLDREIFTRSRRDGECLPVIYHPGDGLSEIRIVEPEQIVQPPQPRDIEDAHNINDGNPVNWMFGVATPDGDIAKPLGFHVVWQPGNWSDFSFIRPDLGPECGVWIKLNTDRNVKRGVSDFYPALEDLNRANKLAVNGSVGAALRAAIAYIIEMLPGAQQGQAISQITARTDATRQIAQSGGGSRQVNMTKMDAGRILYVPNGQQYKPAPMDGPSSEALIQIFNMIMRRIGRRWQMPEYMITGDAKGGNRASTFVAESPWVKSCTGKQQFYKLKFLKILDAVLNNAIEAGRFSEFGISNDDTSAGSSANTSINSSAGNSTSSSAGGKQPGIARLKQFLSIDAEPPSLVTRDPKTETSQRHILWSDGILSDASYAAQEDLDYEQEQSQGAHIRGALAPEPGQPADYDETAEQSTAIDSRGATSQGQSSPGGTSTSSSAGASANDGANGRQQQEAAPLREGGPGSGRHPESEAAHEATKKAVESSNRAFKKSNRFAVKPFGPEEAHARSSEALRHSDQYGDKNKAALNHQEAADAHKAAATYHAEHGQKTAQVLHEKAAQLHLAAARTHSGIHEATPAARLSRASKINWRNYP